MIKHKLLSNKTIKVSSKTSFFSKKVLIIIIIAIIIIGLVVGLVLYFTVFKKSSGGSTPQPGPQKPTQPGPPVPPGPTQPGPPPSPPTGNIIGTWSSLIGCGSDYFNLISLSGAQPDDYDPKSFTNFFHLVIGDFNKDMSNGKTKYIISIGGENATTPGWTNFFTKLADPSNNYMNIQNLIGACKCRGIVGIDLDLEQTDATMLNSINTILNQIKNFDKNFIIMLTILLGSPSTFAKLLDNQNFDYLSLMLYNGGMYSANGAGAGCDWDQWAEIFLSKGKTGCNTPLKESLEIYAKDANLSAVIPSKVLLGLIIDTKPPNIKLDSTILKRTNALITQYGGGGQMIWVIPGFGYNPNTISDLNALGYKIDATKCGGPSGSCPPSVNPCIVGTGTTCVSTQCGQKTQGVTDAQCSPCSADQTYWPCNMPGFCQVKPNVPEATCM